MSTLVVDTLTGKSTATTITIGSTPVVSASANSLTIRGEGSAQTSVQQGLVKAWVLGSDAAALTGSFNISSGTDQGTGDYQYAITSDMADANYAVATVGTAQNNAEHCYNPARATGTVDINIFDGSAVRDRAQGVHICGDLA